MKIFLLFLFSFSICLIPLGTAYSQEAGVGEAGTGTEETTATTESADNPVADNPDLENEHNSPNGDAGSESTFETGEDKSEEAPSSPDSDSIADLENEQSAETAVETGKTETASQEDIGNGPWEVGEIEVRGNKNIKPKVIIKTGKAKKNKLYKKKNISADIEALMGLGSLENISIDIEPMPGTEVSPKNRKETKFAQQVKVIYSIEEKPAIKKIFVKGHKRLSASSVKEAMDTREKDFYDPFRLREDMTKITEKYGEKGFIDAKASFDTECDEEKNICNITVNVIEGPKAIIAAVDFTGISSFKPKKLFKQITNRPKRKYTPRQIKADLAKISAFYKKNGYADFKINNSSVSFNENRSSVTLHIDVEEGELQYFGATFFSGTDIYVPTDFKPDISYKRGKKYNQELFDETIAAIQNRYADKGYLKAEISYDRSKNEKTGESDITFYIVEHDPVYVGHIDIAGNEATKTYVFRREIAQKEGEVFSASKVRRSQEKIFNLGFIDDVRLVINPSQEDPDKVDLVFDVAEGRPGMLNAGAGISSSDGFVGTLSINHLNLFGRAYKTSLSYNWGKNIQDYNFSISNPWTADKPIRTTLNLYNTRHYKPYQTTLHAYTEKRTGSRISATPRFDDDKYYFTAAYSLERIQVYDVDGSYKSAINEEENMTSSVFLEAGIDTRDSIWDPTRGQKFSLGIEYAGGIFMGDVNYYKPTASYNFNQKLLSLGDHDLVLAISNRFGFAERFGDTKEVPVYERYFLGGADTIRGYKNNGQVGPENGGKVYDVANVELRFPLAKEKRRTIVQFGMFFDIGNSWNKFDEISLRTGRSTNQLKSGAGFGIRFTTPAFPIRLDWGYGFNHNKGEDLSDIYFTMGTIF